MNSKEYFKMLERATINSHNYFTDHSVPFSDYVADPKGKFAIAITKKQYAINAHPSKSHDNLCVELIKTIRPDLEIDSWGNANNSNDDFRRRNVIAYGYPHFLLINLPSLELLSVSQFEEVKKMLLDVKTYNENVDKEGYGDKYDLLISDSDLIKLSGTKMPHTSEEIDSIIKQLENFITDDYVDTNEVIVGKPLSEKKTL